MPAPFPFHLGRPASPRIAKLLATHLAALAQARPDLVPVLVLDHGDTHVIVVLDVDAVFLMR